MTQEFGENNSANILHIKHVFLGASNLMDDVNNKIISKLEESGLDIARRHKDFFTQPVRGAAAFANSATNHLYDDGTSTNLRFDGVSGGMSLQGVGIKSQKTYREQLATAIELMPYIADEMNETFAIVRDDNVLRALEAFHVRCNNVVQILNSHVPLTHADKFQLKPQELAKLTINPTTRYLTYDEVARIAAEKENTRLQATPTSQSDLATLEL
jgi:hypothetical protein